MKRFWLLCLLCLSLSGCKVVTEKDIWTNRANPVPDVRTRIDFSMTEEWK